MLSSDSLISSSFLLLPLLFFFSPMVSIAGVGTPVLCPPQSPSPCLAEGTGPAGPWPLPVTCPRSLPPSLSAGLQSHGGAVVHAQMRCAWGTRWLQGTQQRARVKYSGLYGWKILEGSSNCCCHEKKWDLPSPASVRNPLCFSESIFRDGAQICMFFASVFILSYHLLKIQPETAHQAAGPLASLFEWWDTGNMSC